MSARRVDPTDDGTPDRAKDARRGRVVARGRLSHVISLATAGVALVSILLLVPGPDHDGVTRAAARTTRVARTRPARVVIHARMTQPSTRQANVAQAAVTIFSNARSTTIPTSFLGLSTEYWALPFYERHLSLFERVLSLVHVRGDRPLVLRIGGDSADHAFWVPGTRTMPHWVFKVTPAWLRRTSAVVRRLGVRLILDLNLVTGSPLTAARWAQAAEQQLPRRTIVGFEVGNEPDLYDRWYWLATVSKRRLATVSQRRHQTGVVPSDLSAHGYTQDFRSYAHALAHVAPGVPLVGPAAANPALHVNWISSLLNGAHPGLGIVSAHRYPFSSCVARSSASYPTIQRVLSPRASAGIAQSVSGAVRLAHHAGLPFRLTELNSVTCGGLPGVSDTFATALWAPDALFELVRAGVDGANVHVRARAINAAFTLTRAGLTAHPLLYGLILFARTLGTDPRLVRVHLHAPQLSQLKVWAVRVSGDDLHVLLIDKGSRPVKVALRLPATGPATVERLLAPSVSSRAAVTLDGRHLAGNGSWRGRYRTQTITPDVRGYELTIPRFSAALVGVHLSAGARAAGTALGPATGAEPWAWRYDHVRLFAN